MVTVIGDRESDIFALYASAADESFHVLVRSMHDRKLADDTGLYATIDAKTVVDRRPIVLPARRVSLSVLHTRTPLCCDRPRPSENQVPAPFASKLAADVVDVREPDAPAAPSRCIGGFYQPQGDKCRTGVAHSRLVQARWLSEQLFRVLRRKASNLRQSARHRRPLLKLVAIATKAAVITIQLLQHAMSRQQPIQLPSLH